VKAFEGVWLYWKFWTPRFSKEGEWKLKSRKDTYEHCT